MNIKEKLSNIDEIIFKKDFLNKLIKISEKGYNIDTLVNLGYVSVIKKGEIYYNNMIKGFKNPYIIGGAYMDFNDFMFGGFDRYNKEGFITQVSNIFTVYNLKYSRELEILGIKFKFKKVKKDFLYGKRSKMISSYNINFMTKERLFLEYIRDYMDYDINKFTGIYITLDEKNLNNYIKKYPVKKVVLILNKIKECI